MAYFITIQIHIFPDPIPGPIPWSGSLLVGILKSGK